MKLYHWHGVLKMWMGGDIVVMANTLEQARQLACEKLAPNPASYDEPDDEPNDDQILVMSTMPNVYDTPTALAFMGSS